MKFYTQVPRTCVHKRLVLDFIYLFESGVRDMNLRQIAPKLQKCWIVKIAFKIISKMLKQPNFFHSQPSILPKEAPAKFYLSTIVVLRL